MNRSQAGPAPLAKTSPPSVASDSGPGASRPPRSAAAASSGKAPATSRDTSARDLLSAKSMAPVVCSTAVPAAEERARVPTKVAVPARRVASAAARSCCAGGSEKTAAPGAGAAVPLPPVSHDRVPSRIGRAPSTAVRRRLDTVT
ncbi:hypothetical protein ACRAR1_03690 [Streptomyces sanyensis]|uniref:hypothetical protein n=1 Tax=Streptomyces sanyensis TaxID=568869 RepID=UPI003D785781